MKNLIRIVVATDFSMSANAAVTRAAMLARQHGAELHVLHVLSPLALYPGQLPEPAANGEARQATARRQLDAMSERVIERYGIAIHIAQRIGRAHTRIAEYAAEVAADLVVAGVRGENSRLSLMLGSTAWRLLRVCACPVLVVRHVPIETYRRVLATVDFFPYTQAVCDLAQQLADGDAVRLLHVLTPQGQDEQAHAEMRAIANNLMTNLQAALPYATTGHIETGYPPLLIVQRALEWKVDLIVLGRHGQGGLEACLLGSVSKDVAQAANCDVLLVGAV